MHVHSKDLFINKKNPTSPVFSGYVRFCSANAVTIQSLINGFITNILCSKINLVACRENSNALFIKV
ncbi:hypothetical protein DMI65_15905 [Escherichia coli]|nr:hypothetical protein [Escherichia coli]